MTAKNQLFETICHCIIVCPSSGTAWPSSVDAILSGRASERAERGAATAKAEAKGRQREPRETDNRKESDGEQSGIVTGKNNRHRESSMC